MPVVQHQLVLVLPRPRLRSCRRPFRPSRVAGPYRLPHPVVDQLQVALAPAKNREAALTLATFLGRFWSAPGRLGMVFPIDRRALAGHRDLDLTEARVRGAIRLLEEIGFLIRETAEPGARYHRTPEGLHRRPIAFRFGPDFQTLLETANRRPRRGPGKAQDGRRPRPLPHPSGRRDQHSWVLERPLINSPKSISQVSAVLVMGEIVKELPRKGLDPKGEVNHNPPSSRLEAALQRLGEAIGVRRDLERDGEKPARMEG